MSSEQNKAIVRRFFKAFEDDDLNALREVLSPDLVAYYPNPMNREEHINGIRAWNEKFSENRYEIHDQIAEGDRVATQVTFRCIHTKAEYLGVPPTGRRIEMSGVTLERIKDGRIVERRILSDKVGLLKQLGLIPSQVSSGQ